RQIAMLARKGAASPVAPSPSDSVRVQALPPPGTAAGEPTAKIQIATADPAPLRLYKPPAKASAPIIGQEPVRPTGLFVQAGSFVRLEFAQRMQRKLSPLGRARITQAVVGSYTFYRVRVGPLQTVAEGDRVLDYVIAYGYPDARLVAH
ncbi:MAG: SPOR domain-containing protein, partial [Alphaproteobacteria bacterium]